jgi:ADP-ribosyl-[dinitrogen reductase] hydrolase
MIGAIIGDIVGSPYEHGFSRNASVSSPDFPLFNEKSRFTDDTVLTCATAKTLLTPSLSPYKNRFARQYRAWAIAYPDRGYGGRFKQWFAAPKMEVLDSYANGSMMRCSPIGLFYDNREAALQRALQSIAFTHNSPESARGVQSIVDAIFMAAHGTTKEEIKNHVQIQYGHMLNLTLNELRARASKDIRCNLSAPQALICFMLSTDYESAIRYAVYTDGDTDTTAAIAGAIAEAFYGIENIPIGMIGEAKKRLAPEMITLVNQFYARVAEVNPRYKNYSI